MPDTDPPPVFSIMWASVPFMPKLTGLCFWSLATSKKISMYSEIASIIKVELAGLKWVVGRSVINENEDGKKLSQWSREMSDQFEACRPSSVFGGIIPRAMDSFWGVSKARQWPNVVYVFKRSSWQGFFVCLFLYFWPCCTACGISAPQSGSKPPPSALEVCSPNHWATRKVLFWWWDAEWL